MVFPFTFSLNIPGVINPFASHKSNQTPIGRANEGNAVISHDSEVNRSRAAFDKIARPRSSSSPAPPTRSSGKRGWEPSSSEPSYSATTLASTAGYLDTPAKYKHTIPDEYHNINMSDSIHQAYDLDEEMPPLKRRRGLAGSIISTAVSAALIGSAVGLTVYRFWRARGKETLLEPSDPPEAQQLLSLPPPPYQQEQWQPAVATVKVTPPTPVQASPRSVRKSRHLQVASSRRPIIHHRKSRSRVQVSSPPIPVTPTHNFPTQPEFNFGYNQENQVEQTPLEDQMDWIGDKLSMLIEQGKRALGTEVVVMSDAKEDEVDDGSGGWEEEDNNQPRTPSGSLKHCKRPRSVFPPSLSYGSAPTPSNSSSFAPSSAPASHHVTPCRTHSRGISYESGVGFGLDSGSRNWALNTSSSFMEDSSSWESTEIREGMQKARLRYLERIRG